MNRKEIAEQLEVILHEQVNLKPDDRQSLHEAIKELEKNCANCAYSFISDNPRLKELRYNCMKSGDEMGDDYEPTHFCTFHETKATSNE